MVTCTVCGSDVTGKKFCPDCGAPVQPPQTAQVLCPACNGQLPASSAFCMHCGHNMSMPVTPQMISCTHCGHQSAPGTRFCGGCGQVLQQGAAATQSQYAPPPASSPYVQSPAVSGPYTPVQTTSSPYADPQSSYQQPYQPQQYSQPQPQYPQQQSQYAQQPYQSQQYSQPQQQSQYSQQPYQSQPYTQQPQYPQQQPQPYYGQQYQQQPMMGQQQMVLRCPTCMAMGPMGTTNCVSCGTSLAGVVPTPANAQAQQGGLGGMLQGNGGKVAMGVLGGAAAVIGGEMLLHGVENSIENGIEGDMGFGERRRPRRDEGLLGELGKDLGLF